MISAPHTSLFGSSGGYEAPARFILSSCAETQNQCAGWAAKRYCFTDHLLGNKAATDKGSTMTAGLKTLENARMRGRGHMHTHTHTHESTHLWYLCKDNIHMSHMHMHSHVGTSQSAHAEGSKKKSVEPHNTDAQAAGWHLYMWTGIFRLCNAPLILGLIVLKVSEASYTEDLKYCVS